MTIDDLRDALEEHGPLLNQRQVAERLGIGAPAVAYRMRAGTMPEPVARDAGGRPLWLPEQFEQ